MPWKRNNTTGRGHWQLRLNHQSGGACMRAGRADEGRVGINEYKKNEKQYQQGAFSKVEIQEELK